MRRAWILPVAGAVLVGTATILGLILFRKYGVFELTLPELTIWSVVVGTMTVAFLGLVFVEMRAPSVRRRTRYFLFGLFGGVCGLIAGVVFGIVGIQVEVCGPGDFDALECGWSVLGVGSAQSFWPALGLVAAIGVAVGAVAGVTTASLTRRSGIPVTAMPGV
jgi:hypothetical protein